jgi:hypothetical protein
MTTDTALGVTKKVVEDRGAAYSQLPALEYRNSTVGKPWAVSLDEIPYVVCMTWPFHNDDILTALLASRIIPPLRFPHRRASRCLSVCNNQIKLFVYDSDRILLGYMATEENKPLLPPGMEGHLKKDLDQSFEF